MPKIAMCAHLTMMGWYTLSLLIFAFYLIQRTSKPNNGDRTYFCGRVLMKIKWYQPRMVIHLQVKIRFTSNTFSWPVRLTSNRQVKLRVTSPNLARFSAKCIIDSKKLTTDDRIYQTKKSLADIMAKYCVVFQQSPFEDLIGFRVRHVLGTTNNAGRGSFITHLK